MNCAVVRNIVLIRARRTNRARSRGEAITSRGTAIRHAPLSSAPQSSNSAESNGRCAAKATRSTGEMGR